jgi:DNA replication initiation complex subunit (GINS family)
MVQEDETFNFETIAQVYREERNSKTLIKLPLNFFENLVNYMKELKDNYIEERSKDPMSSKTMMLEDEYIKAQKRTSQIYEHRERKIVLLALAAANSRNPDLKLLTKNERNAFNEIVNTLSSNREHIILEEEQDTCESKTFLTTENNNDLVLMEKDANDSEIAKNEEIKEESEKEIFNFEQDMQENPVLLILEDVPSFETEKRSYNLKKGDAISLSKNVAKILCTHKKARVIKYSEKGF